MSYDPKVSGPWSDGDDYPPGDPGYGAGRSVEPEAKEEEEDEVEDEEKSRKLGRRRK